MSNWQMEELRQAVAVKCLEIKSEIEMRGLNMPRITVIARDPDNVEMYICVTNEPDVASLQGICGQVVSAPPTPAIPQTERGAAEQ